jgi:hypothetical protein
MVVKGSKSLVSEHLPLEDIPHITLPSGERGIKRIAFLADVRNKALRPLQDSETHFNKLLFINDVIFNPIDAVQLLFSTNVDSHGRTQYGSACAVDFGNAFKFYDRYATRDLEGHETGLPFFPWFTGAGEAASRQDALAQKDAVRVRSCWGGMTAFDASLFQTRSLKNQSNKEILHSNSSDLPLSPLRFRSEMDPFWDASECCLIHADLAFLRNGNNNASEDSGVYINPYVRVAYDSASLSWLPYTRRAERLYPPIHNILSKLLGMPAHNPRRLEQPGDEIVEKVWRYDENDENISKFRNASRLLIPSYHVVERIAGPGGFCGRRQLSVLNSGAREGEKNWMTIPLPTPPT